METEFSRRQTVRHSVRPSRTLHAEISVNGKNVAVGKIVDLSLAGIHVLLHDGWMEDDDLVYELAFHVAGTNQSFRLECAVVQKLTCDDGLICGLEFTDLDHPSKRSQLHSLWFLIADECERQSRAPAIQRSAASA